MHRQEYFLVDNMLQIEPTRIERDLLGEKQIPLHSYYGIHTLRAIENFQISGLAIGQQSHFICALAQVKKASAQTNLHFQKISEQTSTAIQKACNESTHSWSGQSQVPSHSVVTAQLPLP